MNAELPFKGFRKIMDEKKEGKKLHYKDKKATGMPVSEIKAKVRDSDLSHYIKQLSLGGLISTQEIRAPYIFSTYKSIKNNLNDDFKIKRTPWARYINWTNYRAALRRWFEEYFTESFWLMNKQYYETKTPYSLSPFTARSVINSFIKYGYNAGSWDTELTKKWVEHASGMMKQITWTDLNLNDVSKEYMEIENVKEGWEELCMANPMFSIIRHDATSGWPDYHKQTVEYVLRTYWYAIQAMPDGIVTMYHRRHGYVLQIDKGVPNVVLKVRFVGGVEYVVKIHGLYVTWSFKQSAPDWTMYYRPWKPEYDNMAEFFDGFDGFVMTLDATGHDQHHDGNLLNRLKDVVTEDMPSHIKESHDKEYDGAFVNPRVLVSPFELIASNKTIATSGSPSIPLYESLTTDANITLGIFAQHAEVIFRRIQIDDAIHAANKVIDLKQLAKYLGANFGSEISPNKTEVLDLTHQKESADEQRFIVFLQVGVGELYKDPKKLSWIVEPNTDKNFYLGHPARRDHREEMRERIRQTSDGDIRWLPDPDINIEPSRLTNVQRILGTLCSLGPQCPVELFDLKVKWLSSYRGRPREVNPVWTDVIDYIKAKPRYEMGNFGFDPGFGIKRLNEIY
jgi:hypothetical protein